MFRVLLFFLSLLFATPADAACVNPDGAEGKLIYNDDYNIIQFCNGSMWIGLGNPVTAGVADGDKGDITVTGSGATWTIDDGVVSYGKIQDMSAPGTLLGRATAGAGPVEEITIGSGLVLSGTTLSAAASTETDPEVGTLTNGKWCTTDGSVVNCTYDAPAGTPAGADGQIQFNDGGSAFGADAALHWDNTGKRLGIGNTDPQGKLHVGSVHAPGSAEYYAGSIVVENTIPALTLVDSDGTTWLDHNNSNNRSWWYWTGSNWSQRMYLTTGGALWIAGALTQNSDRSMKRDIQPIASALDKIDKLRGVSFEWKDESFEPGRHLGVIAQEVEEVFPEVVQTQENGTKSVAYTDLVAPLIQAVKELKAANDNLRDDNTELQGLIQELGARVERLEAAK